ncbi:MAG: hypothetical protein WHS83_18235 [Chloroflexus sp.]|uniref:hypothetical protein n=1 Tax=Chloroflexus sp. TaxID=1904827 RepID=UPI0030A5B815
MPSRAELIALLAHHPRGASFGVRQPCCRAGCAHDPARFMSLTRLVTQMPGVLATIMELVGNE